MRLALQEPEDFPIMSDSVGHFDSVYIDYVISIFMILFGINFNLYYFMLLGDFKAFWKNEELRVYLGIIATATILITLNTNQMYGSIMKAFRYALFQVSTIIRQRVMRRQISIFGRHSPSVL